MGCALVVLASGLSERFSDGEKLLATVSDKPIVQHVIDNLAEIDFARRYAVVPKDSALVELFSSAGYQCVTNPHPEKGQGHSLQIGARAVQADGYSAMCIALGDMPLINKGHIINMLQRSDRNDIIMSECKGVKMPPAYFSGEALHALSQASGDSGAKNNMDMSTAAAVSLSAFAAQDIDTRADLDRVQSMMRDRAK